MSTSEIKNTNQLPQTRVLGYQMAKVLTDQELLAVTGALCPAGQGSTWSNGTSECNCKIEDDCK